MKQKHNKKKLLPALLCTMMLGAAALAPSAFAQEGITTTMQPLAEDVASVASESSAVSEYNLASEDWDALLGVSSEEESTVEETSSAVESSPFHIFAGNRSSDGGMSILLIAAIIAFALGGIGVVFFIYSQFIYKAKLRRRMEAEKAGDEAMELNFNDVGNDATQISIPPAEPVQPEQPTAEPKEEPRQTSSTTGLSDEDERRLNEINWDKFFSENHNKDDK